MEFLKQMWFVLIFVKITIAMDNLRVAYQWKIIDYDFPTDQDRRIAINNREFIPENNLPLGLEVFGDRLFITVPRWKDGVAASLTYIKLTGNITIKERKKNALHTNNTKNQWNRSSDI